MRPAFLSPQFARSYLFHGGDAFSLQRMLAQLAETPPATVVFEFAMLVIQQIGWGIAASAIYDGLKLLVHREHKTRFRFVIHKDQDTVTAEIETLSEAALKAALKALRELDKENDGLFVRESRRWRRAGTGKRRRREPRKKSS